MKYAAYQAHADWMLPLQTFAAAFASAFEGPTQTVFDWGPSRMLTAACSVLDLARLTHQRPAFGVERVALGDRQFRVREEAVLRTPFATLLHFRKTGAPAGQPRVLMVAPMSGHFATLLRETVRTMLPEHDVYITDWHNARDVPLADGGFGFDDYVAHIIRFMEHIGPGGHIVAVCQPCVQVVAAAALMAEDENPAEPRSIVLMAGPVDVRANPTKVNELAMSKPIAWFKNNLIAEVPWRFKGAGRRVYPGFVQLSAFMSMIMQRHVKAHVDLFGHLVDGNQEQAAVTREFYDEYFAVLDLPAEFYLETVGWIFQEARLATGDLTYRGRKVDPRAIRKSALLTVEGERDDICGLGQTAAAHDLCTTIKPFRKRHHMQAGVGHYGVFSGRRWEQQIYPIVRNVILSADA